MRLGYVVVRDGDLTTGSTLTPRQAPRLGASPKLKAVAQTLKLTQ